MSAKYNSQSAKARPWQEIEEYYNDLVKHSIGQDKVLELVRHIKSGSLHERIFACTSMGKLVISIYDPIEWNREALHIEFEVENQRWVFKYFSIPNEKPEFEKQYNAELGLKKFDLFISMLKW